jgi:2-oxoisovalerate dehydrogenase E1 component
MVVENIEGVHAKHRNSKMSGKSPQANGKKSLLNDFTKEQLAYFYRVMCSARLIDNKLLILLRQGKGFFHIGCSGHEAAQIGVAAHINPNRDWSYPYYRNLAYCLTLGMTIDDVMLEFYAKKEAPSTGGRQMYAHWGDPKLRIVSQSSPTGTQYLQATGTGLGCKRHNESSEDSQGCDVVYVSSGEGATSQGDFHEAINEAARRKLPVIFHIEDNGYAISVPIRDQVCGESVYKATAGYEGLHRFDVDGTDFFEVYETAKKAVQLCRNGEGPCLINSKVVRLLPHSSSDNHLKYRTREEIEADKQADCVPKFEERLLEAEIFTREELNRIKVDVKAEIDRAASWAERRPEPESETAKTHVFSDIPTPVEFEASDKRGESIVMVDAINHALDEELRHNPKMLIYGEDVADGKGGVFTATQGLTATHGIDRVFNSQLAESTIIGTAIGLSVMGYKPVVEIQFGDYIWPAMMQIRNEAAMMRYRSNNNWKCPMVVRVPVGGYIHGGHYHSQNVEAFFAHIPGLYIAYPSNAADAKGLLKTACRMDDPILFLEHKYLYRQGFAKALEPDENYFLPFGKANLVRQGTEISIITYGALVYRAVVASQRIERELGIQVEVIDLRTIIPYDKEAILKSVKKTGKVLVVHEDTLTQGFGGELSAFISENCFEYLDAPITRVAGADTPVPYHTELEKEILPDEHTIFEQLKKLAKY